MSRTPTFEEIGARIRDIRHQKKLTQDALAVTLQVSRPVVSKIESGKKAINSVELRVIADRLGVSTDFLTRPIEDQNSITLFRATGQEDPNFVDAVTKVNGIFEEMLGQIHLAGESKPW